MRIPAKITDELTFKLWGFSTVRMVLILNGLGWLYLFWIFSPLADRGGVDCYLTRAYLDTLGGLLGFTWLFCFMPPFNFTKLYVCWPLTAFLMFALMPLVPL